MAPSNVRHKAEPARPANTALRVSMCTAPDPAFVASYAPIKSGRGVSAMFQDVRSYAELRRRSRNGMLVAPGCTCETAPGRGAARSRDRAVHRALEHGGVSDSGRLRAGERDCACGRERSELLHSRNSMLLAAPEAIYTHFNISNGFFNSTYLMTPTPDPKTVSARMLGIGSRAHTT